MGVHLGKQEKIRFPEVVEDARKLMNAGADTEMILVFMRERGLDIADCIYSIQDLQGKPHAVAKELVMHSRAWSDSYKTNMQIRQAALEAIRILAESNDPKLPKIILEDEKDDSTGE